MPPATPMDTPMPTASPRGARLRSGRLAPRFARILALVLVLLVPLAGCGGGSGPGDAPDPAAEGPRRGGQAVVGTGTDIAGINPVTAPSSVITTEIVRHLFLSLVEEKPDFKTIDPQLAESWELSEDRTVLTFHLRDDLQWSDGTPITADDVEFTYRAWTDPDIAWEGAFALEEVEGVEVVDPHTVRFRFRRPYSTQLLDVAGGSVILPKHAWGGLPFAEWRANADWFREHLVVSGPFDLASWAPQQELVLERNPLYHEDGLPYLDRIVFRVIPDQSSQLTQLRNGQLDYVLQLAPEDVEAVVATPQARVIDFWSRGYIAIGWNCARPPFDRLEVRRALTYGIDRQTLVDSIWGPRARVIASPVPPDVWAYNPEAEPLPYDPDRARELLEEAGWTDSDGDGFRDRDGEALRFALITNVGNRQREDALVLIQDQLRRVGIDVHTEALEFHTMIERAFAGDFDAVLSGWTIPTTFDFRYAFHTAEIADGSNFIGYSNPEVDRLLEEVRGAPSLEAAEPLLDRLQVVVQEEQPYTFLWQSQRLHGVRNRLQGVEPNHLFSLNHMERWWVTEAR